jgi:hypothetical protein
VRHFHSEADSEVRTAASIDIDNSFTAQNDPQQPGSTPGILP